ncbi:hypothetical protein ACPFMM_003531 [Vibrio cholerae]
MIVGKIVYCNFNKYIEDAGLINDFVKFIKSDIEGTIISSLDKSKQIIASEKRKKQGGLFS